MKRQAMQNPDDLNQSTCSWKAAKKRMLFDAENSNEETVDANAECKQAELSSKCVQIDDTLSWELFCQNAG